MYTGYENIEKEIFNMSQNFNNNSEEKQKEIINNILKLIRSINTFPIYKFSQQEIIQELKKIQNKKVNFNINQNNQLVVGSTLGNTLLDFLFPNIHQATQNNRKSMYEKFYNDQDLRIAIRFALKHENFSNVRNSIFRPLKLNGPTPTNFSPILAKTIYSNYCSKNGTIYDFCAGYGGRMLGILGTTYNYIGTDPNPETFFYLNNLKQIINHNFDNSIKIFNSPAEDLILEENSIDFTFTCPPYYNLEVYSEDNNQSINKYKTYQDWTENFINKVFLNIKKCLKKECYLGIVACNFKSNNIYYNFIEDLITSANLYDFVLINKIQISKRQLQRKKDKPINDYEHLLVFQNIK